MVRAASQGQIHAEWVEALRSKPLFIGLDRDGTLVPIHNDPAQAVLPAAIKSLLLECAELPEVVVSVLSARSTEHLKSDFGEGGLILAGNYGLEICFPDGSSFVHPVADRARNLIASAKEKIQSLLHPGIPVIFEDHGLSLCLHWHLVPPPEQESAQMIVASAQAAFSELHFRSLPTSYEVLPMADWDKSRALDIISERALDIASHLCIFIGDSDADEPAFRWVNERRGLSFRVGTSRSSRAMFELDSPTDVANWIRQVVDLRMSPRPA